MNATFHTFRNFRTIIFPEEAIRQRSVSGTSQKMLLLNHCVKIEFKLNLAIKTSGKVQTINEINDAQAMHHPITRTIVTVLTNVSIAVS
jgi:hypothetical protein